MTVVPCPGTLASCCNGLKAGSGSYCTVRNVLMENCRVERPAKVRTVVPDARPALWLDDCTEIDQEGFKW